MPPRPVALLTTLLLVLAPGVVHAADSVEVEAIEHKVLVAKPDHAGDIWLSVKLTVRNLTNEDARVSFEIQAFDKDDFEVFDIELSGTVKAFEARSLSDHSYINADLYKTIVRWTLNE